MHALYHGLMYAMLFAEWWMGFLTSDAEGAAFDNLDFGRVHQLDSTSSLNEMLWGKGSDHLATQLAGRTPVQTEEPAENDVHKPQLGGLKIPVHSSPESLTQDKPGKDEKLILAMERNTAGIVSDSDAVVVVQNPYLSLQLPFGIMLWNWVEIFHAILFCF